MTGRAYGLRRRSLVLRLPDLLDDLLRKRFEVARIARGDDATIRDDGLVLPLGDGIDHVGLDGMPRRHLAGLRDAGLDQWPRHMADRGDRFAGRIERLDQRQRIVIDATDRDDLAAGSTSAS